MCRSHFNDKLCLNSQDVVPLTINKIFFLQESFTLQINYKQDWLKAQLKFIYETTIWPKLSIIMSVLFIEKYGDTLIRDVHKIYINLMKLYLDPYEL